MLVLHDEGLVYPDPSFSAVPVQSAAQSLGTEHDVCMGAGVSSFRPLLPVCCLCVAYAPPELLML